MLVNRNKKRFIRFATVSSNKNNLNTIETDCLFFRNKIINGSNELKITVYPKTYITPIIF